MTSAIAKLQTRREKIVQDLLAIRSVERGALSEQYFTRPAPPGEPPGRRGPYYVLSHWVDGQNRSRRVKCADVDQVRLDLANHERFMDLCHELENLTYQLGQAEREASASDEAVKKGCRSAFTAKYNN